MFFLVVRCQGLCGRSVAVVGDGAYRQLVAFLRDEEEVYLGPVVRAPRSPGC